MHTCTINSDRNVLPSESGDKGTKLQGVNTRDLISSKSSNSSSNAFVHNSSIGVDVHESLMVCVYQKADPLTLTFQIITPQTTMYYQCHM